jgi:hypothetical protein
LGAPAVRQFAVKITVELEALDYDRLIGIRPLTQTAPKPETIELARKQPKAPAA